MPRDRSNSMLFIVLSAPLAGDVKPSEESKKRPAEDSFRCGLSDGVDYRRISIYLAAAYVPAYLMDSIIYLAGSEKALTRPLYQFLVAGRMYLPMLGVILALLMTKAGIRSGLKEYGLRAGKRLPQLLLLGASIPYLIYAVGVAYGYLAGLPVADPVKSLYPTLSREAERLLSRPPCSPSR